jgi:hypothetical protein
MPEIEFAFLADAADSTPGQKFHVIGGGISRIAGPAFPHVHPHISLVVCLAVTAPELGREHEVRIVLLGPDGQEIAGAVGAIAASGTNDGRDTYVTFAVDLWSITFPVAGDYSFRLLVNGSERKRLPLVLAVVEEAGGAGEAGSGTGGMPDPRRQDPDTPRRYDA